MSKQTHIITNTHQNTNHTISQKTSHTKETTPPQKNSHTKAHLKHHRQTTQPHLSNRQTNHTRTLTHKASRTPSHNNSRAQKPQAH